MEDRVGAGDILRDLKELLVRTAVVLVISGCGGAGPRCVHVGVVAEMRSFRTEVRTAHQNVTSELALHGEVPVHDSRRLPIAFVGDRETEWQIERNVAGRRRRSKLRRERIRCVRVRIAKRNTEDLYLRTERSAVRHVVERFEER